MKKICDPRLLSLVFALAASGACGDDDDDVSNNNGGRAGSSSAGRGGSNLAGSGAAEAGAGGHAVSDGGEPNDVVGGGATLGGSAGEAGSEAGASAAGEGSGGEGGAAAALELSDAQVLLVLDTVNQGEVEVAYAALPHLAVGSVQAFAQQMIDDHSAARQDVLTVANMLDLAPLPSDVQQMLKAKAEAQVADFHASNDDALDALYIDGQVADHAAVLTLLGDLTEAADAAELKNLIAMLELDVQAHYDEAVELKAALP